MAKFHQHSDEVIEAARSLRRELMLDSPFGNESEARKWFLERHTHIETLANQVTETEEKLPRRIRLDGGIMTSKSAGC